jgi:hypothetical protein
VQITYTAGNLTVHNQLADPAVVHATQKAERMYLISVSSLLSANMFLMKDLLQGSNMSQLTIMLKIPQTNAYQGHGRT